MLTRNKRVKKKSRENENTHIKEKYENLLRIIVVKKLKLNTIDIKRLGDSVNWIKLFEERVY